MKRTLSVLLTLLILVTSVIGAVNLAPASALTTSAELNNAANWYDASINNSGTPVTTGITEANSSWGTATAVGAANTPGGKNVPSIKFYGNAQVVFGTLLTFEANKDYTVSFDYYGEATGTTLSTTSVFYNIGIIPGVTASTSWNEVIDAGQWPWCSSKDGKLVNQLAASTSASYTVGTDITVPNAAANTWGTFSATFNSGTATTALLYFDNAVLTNTYIANIKLTDLTPAPDEVVPENGWYDVGVNGTATLTNKTIKYNNGWGTVTAVDAANTPGGKNVESVKFHGNSDIAFGKLVTLEKNKTYTLSFDYYVTDLGAFSAAVQAPLYNVSLVKNITKDSSWADIFPTPGIWADNTSAAGKEARLVNIMGNNSNVVGTDVSNLVATANQWNTFTATFQSGDVENAMLVINTFNMNPKATYLANLKVEIVPSGLDEVVPETGWYDVYVNGQKDVLATQQIMYTDDAGVSSSNIEAANTPGGKNVASVALNGTPNYAFGKILSLEKDKNYTLSFDYYATNVTTVGTVTNTPIYALGLVKNITKESMWSEIYANGNPWTDNTSATALANRFLNMTGNNSAAYKVGTLTNVVYGAETWNTFTGEFSSGDVESAMLVLHVPAGFYIANFKLKAAAATVDMNKAEAWQLYNFNTTAVDETATAAASWAKKENNLDAQYIQTGNNSIKVSAQNQVMATRLTDIEKNTDYTVNIKYYSASTNASGYVLTNVAVMKYHGIKGWNSEDNLAFADSSLSYTGPYSQRVVTSASINTLVEAAGWNEFTFGFNSGDNTDLALVLQGVVSEYYIDDVTVTIGKYVPAGKDYGTPQAETVIDFENSELTYSDKEARINVVETTGYDGKPTKALHTVAGTYSNATTLNYAKTTTDSDPIYTIPVKENTVYKLSWRFKMAKGKTPNWYSFYRYYDGQLTNIANVQNVDQGEWLYYSVDVVTLEGQNRLSFTFNAGEDTAESWIDDIKLVETSYKPFAGYNGPQDEVVINFDDFAVPLEQPGTMTVETGPIMNGAYSNALHVKPGTYNSAAFLNWSTVTKRTDSIFNIPVKKGNLYNLSFKLYLPLEEGQAIKKLDYFAFYYIYHDDLITPISVYTMPEVADVRNQWVKITVQFVATDDLIDFTFNAGKMPPEFYLDDIVLREVKPGIIGETELNYADKQFNVVGFDGVNAADLLASKTSVTKLPVSASTAYTLALTLENGAANDQIFVSLDGVNPIGKSSADVTVSAVVKGDKRNRYAYQFVTNTDGYVYIVVKNNSGTLKYSDLSLFRTYSMSTNRDVGRYEDTNVDFNKIEEVKVLSKDGLSYSFESNSPDTGDSALVPMIMIIISLVMVFAVGASKAFRKEREDL